MSDKNIFTLQCPIPKSDYDKVLLAHGGGGKLSHQLINKIFYSQFENDLLSVQHDSAVFEVGSNKMAFTTDSYVVKPIFFPGGNIGELAVYGTVNDLAVAGARPLYISTGFIIEEGFPIEDLWKIVLSMKAAADKAGVLIVTGDTKVVDKGKGDKVFINTSGVGVIKNGIDISPDKCRAGDAVILSGRIADHGIAIMSSREGLEFETTIESDTAPLNHMIQKLLDAVPGVHVMRDPTRGGIASALNEIADAANAGIEIIEEKIPLDETVKGACEILGLDPLYIANEGKVLVFLPRDEAERALELIRGDEFGREAEIIGYVTESNPGMVTMKTTIGSSRIVDMMSGEQLPRIC